MTEPKPQYALEFVLTYDKEKSFTFSGSSDDPWATWLASTEILRLNNHLIGNRVNDETPVGVTISRDGRPLEKSELVEEIRRYHESKRRER